jgi:hypothetical protein
MRRPAHLGHAASALALVLFGACTLDSRTLLEARSAGGVSGTGSSGAAGELGASGSNTQFGGTGAGAGSNGGTGSGGANGTGGRGGRADSGSDSATEGSGGTGGSGSGGVSGVTGDAGIDANAGGCSDVDDNGVEDCRETLLKNPRFDVDASDWQAEPNAQQRWDSEDGRGATGSGALSLVNANLVQTELQGMTMVGSQQCLDVDALRKYTLGAQIFIPDNQGVGYAGINVFLYSGRGCTRTLLHAYTPVKWGEVGLWDGVAGTIETSPATQSMLVRLVTSKPFSQASFKALFDNVLVRAH